MAASRPARFARRGWPLRGQLAALAKLARSAASLKALRAAWRLNGAQHITMTRSARQDGRFAASSLRSPRLAAARPTRSALEDRPLPRREKKICKVFCCGTRNRRKPLNTFAKPSPRPSQTPPQVVRSKIAYFPAFCPFSVFYFFFLKIPFKIAIFGERDATLKSHISPAFVFYYLFFVFFFCSKSHSKLRFLGARYMLKNGDFGGSVRSPQTAACYGDVFSSFCFFCVFFLKIRFKMAILGRPDIFANPSLLWGCLCLFFFYFSVFLLKSPSKMAILGGWDIVAKIRYSRCFRVGPSLDRCRDQFWTHSART